MATTHPLPQVDPAVASKMRWNSKEAAQDAAEMSRFTAQHTPQVMSASLMLQSALGIEMGTRSMGGGLVAKMWEFPRHQNSRTEAGGGDGILDPPRKRLRLAIPTIVVDSPDNASVHDPSEDKPQGGAISCSPESTARDPRLVSDSSPFGAPGFMEQGPQPAAEDEDMTPPDTIILTQPRKRLAPKILQHETTMWTAPHEQYLVFPEFQVAGPRKSATASQGLGAATHEVQEVRSPYHEQPPSTSLLKSTTESLFPPILQHAQEASPPIPWNGLESREDLPLYWDPFLSEKIFTWLEDTSTRSMQSDLTYLELHGEKHSPLRFQAQNLAKLKLTRMTLPVIEQTHGLPFAIHRDWFVIEVRYTPNEHDHSQSSMIMAFPVSAITASYSADLKTTWTLGYEHRVPAVHGRGISVSSLDDFMRACTQRKGVLEMGGMGPLFR